MVTHDVRQNKNKHNHMRVAGPTPPRHSGQPILQRIGPSNNEIVVDVKYMVFLKAEVCMYSTP